MPSAITSSPLKVAVTEHGTRMTATDATGTVVLEGVRGSAAKPYAAVLTTAGQTWSIAPRDDDRVARVCDPHGTVFAEVRGGGFRHDTIALGDGTEIPIAVARFTATYGATFGSLGRARSVWLMPKRPFTLTLSAELLTRPDRELLVAIFAHVGRQKIMSRAQSAATSSSS